MSISSSKLSVADPVKGILVATVVLDGKRCNVYAQLEDDAGKLLPMPASFEAATMEKVKNSVEGLLLAHQGKCAQDKASPFAVKDVTAEGIQLVHETGRRTHDFAVSSILADLPVSSADVLSKHIAASGAVTAKNLWEQIDTAIKSDKTPAIKHADVPKADVPKSSSSLIPSAPALKDLPYVSPFEERVKVAKKLKQGFDNPTSISADDMRLLDQFKTDFSHKLGRSLAPSDVGALEKALRTELEEAEESLRREKAKLKDPALKLIITKDRTEAGRYLEMAKRSSLFDAETFYYFIYQEAIKKGIAIADWDKKWSEFHALDDMDVFVNAINNYINNRIS